MLKAREDVLNTFKSNLISVTPDTKLMQHLEQHQYMKIFFINEIKNDEKKNVNSEILNKYFRYQNSSFLANYLIETNQSKNNEIINQTVDSINELKNAVSKKEIPENENENKIIDIAKKVLEFNNQKKKEQELKY